MQVATTILEQLGGKRFIAMTGAKQLVAGKDSLTFSIGRGATNGINKVRIILDESDTYTVEFWKIRGVSMNKVSDSKNVYADMLQRIFTKETGFNTTL